MGCIKYLKLLILNILKRINKIFFCLFVMIRIFKIYNKILILNRTEE